eukprot:TRINITY_DN5389_c0_g1_i8.p2 TRINITY_DN5389_c0_g1~~TRINITY_DN5389_c0_g1_i8.p2  ORF type:complete len:312 (-),score=44.84 TRINITY_DN5389_c0_g1_i8:70-1005(-)
MGWSFPSDIWSVGCILVELFTGDTLFQTHRNLEHLAMMEAVLGPFPSSLIASQLTGNINSKNETVLNYFVYHSTWDEVRGKRDVYVLDYSRPDITRSELRNVDLLRRLSEIINPREYPEFYDLLCRSLAYDPKQRITAREALDHPFFKLCTPYCTKEPLSALLRPSTSTTNLSENRNETNDSTIEPNMSTQSSSLVGVTANCSHRTLTQSNSTVSCGPTTSIIMGTGGRANETISGSSDQAVARETCGINQQKHDHVTGPKVHRNGTVLNSITRNSSAGLGVIHKGMKESHSPSETHSDTEPNSSSTPARE